MKMRVSSALHDKAQEQVNQCSQRLHTKATLNCQFNLTLRWHIWKALREFTPKYHLKPMKGNWDKLNSELSICCININCSTNTMHALAHNITTLDHKYDIILVQEPWWNGYHHLLSRMASHPPVSHNQGTWTTQSCSLLPTSGWDWCNLKNWHKCRPWLHDNQCQTWRIKAPTNVYHQSI